MPALQIAGKDSSILINNRNSEKIKPPILLQIISNKNYEITKIPDWSMTSL